MKREELGEVFEQYKDRVLMFARRIPGKIPNGSPLTVEDLASCGSIGLMEAVERFDESRGIQYNICRLSDQRCDDRLIRSMILSRHRREQERDLELVKAELSKVLGRTPRPRELAKMDIPLNKYRLQSNVAKVTEVSIDGDEGEILAHFSILFQIIKTKIR